MENVQYDVKVIQQFANQLYAQASSIIWTYSLLGGFAGVMMGLGTAGVHVVAGLVMAAILGYIGFVIGRNFGTQKAFVLQLQAQTALCQVQIEGNTGEKGMRMVA